MAASRQPPGPAVNVQALTSKTVPIQPLVLSVQAQVVGRHQQGAVVGLRQTSQRCTPASARWAPALISQSTYLSA